MLLIFLVSSGCFILTYLSEGYKILQEGEFGILTGEGADAAASQRRDCSCCEAPDSPALPRGELAPGAGLAQLNDNGSGPGALRSAQPCVAPGAASSGQDALAAPKRLMALNSAMYRRFCCRH